MRTAEHFITLNSVAETASPDHVPAELLEVVKTMRVLLQRVSSRLERAGALPVELGFDQLLTDVPAPHGQEASSSRQRKKNRPKTHENLSLHENAALQLHAALMLATGNDIGRINGKELLLTAAESLSTRGLGHAFINFSQDPGDKELDTMFTLEVALPPTEEFPSQQVFLFDDEVWGKGTTFMPAIKIDATEGGSRMGILRAPHVYAPNQKIYEVLSRGYNAGRGMSSLAGLSLSEDTRLERPITVPHVGGLSVPAYNGILFGKVAARDQLNFCRSGQHIQQRQPNGLYLPGGCYTIPAPKK